MGSCAGKPKTVDGVKPEAADQTVDQAKAAILNSGIGETTTVKDKNDATTATNENGDKKDEKTEPVIGFLEAKEEAEAIKEPAPGKDELKTEAPAEAEEKVEGEKVEEKKVDVST